MLKRLLADRNGGVALIIATSMPVFLGGVALTVDTIQWSLAKRMMQRQADSGAIAGAFGLAQGRDVTANVQSDLARNDFVTLTVPTIIENAPTAGPKIGNAKAVRVVVATTMRLPFSGLFIDGMPLRAEATAQVVGQGEYCVIALDTSDATGIKMSGNTSVDLNCGMMSNSVSAGSAVTAGGSSTIKASPIAAVGGVPDSSNYVRPVSLFPYAVPAQDPFAALPDPLATIGNGSTLNVSPKQTKDIEPGTYKSVDIKGTLNMAPGVYYINGGSFSANSSATITGTGVVIILTSSTAAIDPSSIATANINGSANIRLTAPKKGTYAGIVMYQDRRALDSGGSNKINGNSSSKLQGAIYFPGQALEFTGTTGMQTSCLQLVAKRLTFIGNSSISNVCPADSGAASIPGTVIRLVA